MLLRRQQRPVLAAIDVVVARAVEPGMAWDGGIKLVCDDWFNGFRTGDRGVLDVNSPGMVDNATPYRGKLVAPGEGPAPARVPDG
jgi:hypothetical protein